MNLNADILEQGFALDNREDVIRFDALIDAYAAQKEFMSLKHISLINAYDYFQLRQDGGKLFAALLDIHINFLLLHSDIVAASKAWGRDTVETGSVLDSEEIFFRKMEVHKFNSSFIFRYRALWDKLMGFTVLYFVPNKYEDFVSARSRRNSFKKIFSSNGGLPHDFVVVLNDSLGDFDDNFRTPEAHGTGRLRKRSFIMQSLLESPTIELSGHWNFVLQYVVAIGKLFSSSEKKVDEDVVRSK